MGGSQKKVIIRFEDQTVLAGYLPGSGIVSSTSVGSVQFLDVTGRLQLLEFAKIRYVAYVRDFNLNDLKMPERLARQRFLGRPRSEGLWVQITFRDGEILEGLAALDKTLIEDAACDGGIYMTPPDIRTNTQRLFVPRAAMAELTVLGVITNPSKAVVAARVKKTHEGELELPFSEAELL